MTNLDKMSVEAAADKRALLKIIGNKQRSSSLRSVTTTELAVGLG